MGEWGGGLRVVRWKEGNTPEDPSPSAQRLLRPAWRQEVTQVAKPAGELVWGLPWAKFHHQLFLLLASANSQSTRVYKCLSDLLCLSPGQKGAADKARARPLCRAIRCPRLAEAWLSDAPGLPHRPSCHQVSQRRFPGPG